ncbi:hypothetical protein BJX64DRAFT_288142 [Aspergillus heterothallicus]
MWLSLITLSHVIFGALAQQCASSPNGNYGEIASQKDLDALQSNCTIFLGSYYITQEFTSAFVLPGIVNVSNIYAGSHGGFHGVDIPSFDMPDLEYAHFLSLERMDSLESFSVPKIRSLAAGATLGVPSHLDVLKMPALEQSGGLSLTGNFTDVSFPALHTITTGELVLKNINDFAPAAEAETSMNISFPALNSSKTMSIMGRASRWMQSADNMPPPRGPILRVSLPSLTSLEWASAISASSSFSLWGDAFELDMPKLAIVNENINFEGNITALSLPSLERVEGNLTVTAASNPLSIDLPKLTNVEAIHLTGKIERVELPNLKHWLGLHVDTDLKFDCDAFISEWDTAPTSRRVITCVSRAEGESTTQDSTSATGSEEGEAGEDEQAGDNNWSARIQVSGIGVVFASLLSWQCIGLIGGVY